MAAVDSPTALAFTPDGRILVATQFGQLRVVQGGTLLTQPALDLTSVLCTADEEGLLGVAVDPAFASNGFVFLYYTRNVAGSCVNRVSRFTFSGNTASPGSELVLIDQIPATGGNHNAGDLHFGTDGFLYVSVGDGGCDYASPANCGGANDASRDQNILLGKVLRITSSGGIPATNPFQGAGTARCNVTGRTSAGSKCQETFAWGLRNPFRLAFDPNAAGTRFFVNDTGQNVWEEIDEAQAGADYGWNVREGPCANGSTTDCGPPPAGMTNPIFSYSHSESSCAAITGGAFVPNGVWPSSFDGTYLYGDYVCGAMFLLTPNGAGGFTRTDFAADVGAVVNLTFGPSGSTQALYYTNYANGGEVRRIEYTGATNRPPSAAVTASPTFGPLPLAVTFDGSASTDPDAGDTLTYVWSFGDGTPNATTSTPTTSHTYSAAGPFTASLTVRDNRGASSTPATVRIDAGNTPPQATIDTPAASVRFAVGQTMNLHGTATDAQDGTLAASSLSWRVIRHHDTHTHPFLAPTTGNDIPITGPAPEDLAAASNSYLEIQLTATDSAGLATTVTRDLLPHKVDLTFATSPTGLRFEVNGVSYPAPQTLTSWEAYVLSVNAPAQTDGSGQPWAWQSWSDGGAAAHSFATPAAPAAYTATFRASSPPGLVAAYGFDAGSGTVVADSSGQGNTGAISGAAWTTGGKFGSALSFDGVNDWVTVADAGSLDLTSAMTVEAWVNPSALGTSWRTLLFKERSGGVVYSLYANQASTRPVGQVFVGSERSSVGTAALPVNAWTHLAATYDGAALRLYVNGALASSTAVSGSMSASTGPLMLGGNSVWGEWFSGAIDEVRVYNRALAAGEVQTDMNTPVGGSPPPSDTTPPDVSVTAPAGGATVAGTVTVSAAASDNVGVAGVQFKLDGASLGNEDTASPYSVSWDTGGASNGGHVLSAVARDAAGNTTASTGVTVTVNNPPPSTGLVAAYSFNAGSGTTLADGSGAGNAGTVSGATWTTAGKYGSALSFDGVNDWVTVADAGSLDLTSAMTVEAWVNPSALGTSWRTLLFKERSGGVVYSLYANQASTRPVGQVFVGSERDAVGQGALPLNAWTHLAVTYDGASLRLYVNGIQVASTTVTGAMSPSTGVLRLGGNSIWGEWFSGAIDEVRVYNRALTVGEIQTDLNTPLG